MKSCWWMRSTLGFYRGRNLQKAMLEREYYRSNGPMAALNVTAFNS